MAALVISLLHFWQAKPLGTVDNPALIVLPGARNVQAADIYDGQVAYELLVPYPAKPTIDTVRRTLERLGWRLRDRDFLNPTDSVARMANWRDAEIDGRVATTWAAQWENAEGDVVVYGLTYWSPRGQSTEPKGPLHVTITYVGARLVRSVSAAVEEERRRLPSTAPPPDKSPGRDADAFISPTLQFEAHGVDFKPWVRGFVAQLRRNWTRPSSTRKENAQVVIAFDVDKQGALSQIQIVENSPDVALNEAVMQALRASNPTAPLPAAYPKNVVRITASFSYNPVEQPR